MSTYAAYGDVLLARESSIRKDACSWCSVGERHWALCRAGWRARVRGTGQDRTGGRTSVDVSLVCRNMCSGESLLAFLPRYLGWNPSLEIALRDWFSSQRRIGEGRGQQRGALVCLFLCCNTCCKYICIVFLLVWRLGKMCVFVWVFIYFNKPTSFFN